MRSISFLLVLSAVTLAAGSIPLRKQMFFEREIESEQPAVPFIDPTSGLAYRLPNDTFPIHYDIHLETNIHSGNFAFNGVVEILLEAREVTSNITLHYRQIQINQVDLLTVNDENIESEIIFILDEPRDFLIIPTKAPLAIETKYKVIIQYEGTLRTDDAGFYRSSYKNSDGETVWLATTQFESTDARHGFPCYDEPSIKATYTVFLKYDKSYRAISNMPEESRLPVEGSNYVISKFEKSFQFQSYLVAFVISNFDFIASEGAKLPQRVFATPHHVAGGYVDFALEYGIQSIQVLENYLGVDFLLPKIDQIAIPDFAAGAMENYGECFNYY